MYLTSTIMDWVKLKMKNEELKMIQMLDNQYILWFNR